MATCTTQTTGPVMARASQILQSPASVALESLGHFALHLSIEETANLLHELPRALEAARRLEAQRLARVEAAGAVA
ncbi:MAG TPA: hypothetical protein VM639_24370 [Dongiaceae bacterium]|nr:hypothetical protein [Dongiaceae bacterium]